MMMLMSEADNSDNDSDGVEDTRVSKENAQRITDLVMKTLAKEKKEQELHIDESDSDPQPDAPEKPDTSPELDAMRKEIKELKKSLEEHETARKEDLLSQLNEKDRVKYKDKSLEAIELIVSYVREHPKRGLSRTPSDDKTKTTGDSLRDRGIIGSYDVKTKTWK